MGFELNSLGYLASKADRNQVGKQAVRKVRQNLEDHVSAALSYLLTKPEVELRGVGFHVGNERASKAEAGRLKWVGVKPGVADWIFTGPPTTAIELKQGKNKQTPSQKAWAAVFVDGWKGYLDPEKWDGEGMSTENARDLFAPRYYVCRTLFTAVYVLYTRELLRAPTDSKALEASVATVLRWWIVKHRVKLE